jgi:membrane protein DedA with SNARE-associated domain
VSSLLDHILNLHPALLLSIAGALVFLEDAIFIGFVIPGETAAVLAGVGSQAQDVAVWIPIVVIVVAAIAGDSVGYEVGKHFFGPKVLSHSIMAKHQVRIGRAQAFLKERGGAAVFLGRFTAFFRAMMPALAGASQMPYRTFLAWNAVGGVVWGTTFAALGYAAGHSAEALAKKVGWYGTGGVVAVVVIALVVFKIRSERADKRLEEAAGEAPADR